MPVTTIIGLIGTIQGLILAGVVASLGGENRKPNRALALILFIFSVSIAAIVADHAGLFGASIWPVLVEYTFAFLFPPALWYYVDTVLGARSRVPFWVHLVPAVLWLGYLVGLTIGWPGSSTWRWLPPILGIVLYLLVYTIAVAVRTWRGTTRQQTLVSHGVVLRVLIVLLFLLHGAQGIRFFFRDVTVLSDVVPIVGTIIIYSLSILAFRQSRLFAGYEPESVRQKYETSTLTPERAEEIQHRLLLIMDRDKPFMNENLNLAELASRLAVPRAHLSQVINTNLGKSFPQLLNEYRVREAARLLGDGDVAHLTLEAIGYEVGFRSRSGFYSAFKRITGETPAQVRARLS